jgi:hypothetical protein
MLDSHVARPVPEFRECAEIENPDEPLRQGDILAFQPAASSRELPPFGVVVTADCDITRNKNNGVISYVPAFPVELYAQKFIAPRIAADTRTKRLRTLTETISRQRKASQPSHSGMSEHAVEEWVRSGSVAEILSYLGIENNAKSGLQISTLFDDLCTCLRVIDDDQLPFEDQRRQLARLFSSSKNKSSEQQLTDELCGRLQNLPGDAFYLNSLYPATLQEGFVVYLRFVREARDHEISRRYHDEFSNAIMARRAARLKPPYVYRLTQQLADVFASIGLPEEYELRRRSTITESMSDPTARG